MQQSELVAKVEDGDEKREEFAQRNKQRHACNQQRNIIRQRKYIATCLLLNCYRGVPWLLSLTAN